MSHLSTKVAEEIALLEAKIALINSTGKGKLKLVELNARLETLQGFVQKEIVTEVTVQPTINNPIVEFQETQIPLNNNTCCNSEEEEPEEPEEPTEFYFLTVKDQTWVNNNALKVLKTGQHVFLPTGGYYLGDDIKTVNQLQLLGKGVNVGATFVAHGDPVTGEAIGSNRMTFDGTLLALTGSGVQDQVVLRLGTSIQFAVNYNNFANRSGMTVGGIEIQNAAGQTYIIGGDVELQMNGRFSGTLKAAGNYLEVTDGLYSTVMQSGLSGFLINKPFNSTAATTLVEHSFSGAVGNSKQVMLKGFGASRGPYIFMQSFDGAVGQVGIYTDNNGSPTLAMYFSGQNIQTPGLAKAQERVLTVGTDGYFKSDYEVVDTWGLTTQQKGYLEDQGNWAYDPGPIWGQTYTYSGPSLPSKQNQMHIDKDYLYVCFMDGSNNHWRRYPSV